MRTLVQLEPRGFGERLGSAAFLVQLRAAALRTEREQAMVDRVEADRVRALLGYDRLQKRERVTVETADDSGLSDRHIQTPRFGIVHHNIRRSGKGQGFPHLAAVSLENEEGAAVRCAEESARIEPEPVRSLAWNLERPRDRLVFAVDDDDLRR